MRAKTLRLAAALLIGVALVHAAASAPAQKPRRPGDRSPIPASPDKGTPPTDATPDATGRKWAVIVGVNDYEADIRPLQYAVSDARRLRDTLIDPNVGKFPPANVILLVSSPGGARSPIPAAPERPAPSPTSPLSPDTRPTRSNIIHALMQTVAKAGPGDTIWFYFAGHGTDDAGLSYLLPTDCKVGDLKQTAISTKYVCDLLDANSRQRVKRRVVILDACHSGSRARDSAPPSTEIWNKEGTVAIAACGIDQKSYEFPLPTAGGVFTYYLVRGLRGEADTSGDKIVTTREVKAYLPPKVKTTVEQEAFALQTPQFFSTVDDLPLTYAFEPAVAQLPPPASQPLTSKEPLGPALVLALEETRRIDGAASPSDLAVNAIRQTLVAQNIPLLDKEAARLLRKILDPNAAAAKTAALGARFLLRGAVTIDLSKFQGRISTRFVATASITAQLFDDAGNALYAGTFATDQGKSGVTEGAAALKAAQEVAAKMTAEMLPIIKKTLEIKPVAVKP